MRHSHLPSPSPRVRGRAVWWAVWWAAVVGMLGGCGDEVATRPAPTPEKLRGLVEQSATRLGRVSCAGCPDRWETQACRFGEELVRSPGALGAERCAVVQPALGFPGLPERLAPAAAATLAASKESLSKDARHRDVEAALRVYAFGADLQRLGSLELWVEGLQARATAVGWLGKARPDAGWPGELLALEAAAPAPARVVDAAVLATYNRLPEPGWRERSALAVAADHGAAAVRAASAQRADHVRGARQALGEGWPDGQLPVDLLDAWQASERVRTESIRLALDATLSRQPRCPADLQALVPEHLVRVPDGWSLDAATCRAVETGPTPTPAAPVQVPVAGAMAAQP